MTGGGIPPPESTGIPEKSSVDYISESGSEGSTIAGESTSDTAVCGVGPYNGALLLPQRGFRPPDIADFDPNRFGGPEMLDSRDGDLMTSRILRSNETCVARQIRGTQFNIKGAGAKRISRRSPLRGRFTWRARSISQMDLRIRMDSNIAQNPTMARISGHPK